MQSPLLFFAVVGVIGMACLALPPLPIAIFLLAAGVVFGPVTRLLAPSLVLGKLARPMVSAAAVILFEGGLSFKFSRAARCCGGSI